ncbi:MAG: T9SS type A sorting domain-containing protein, partial [Candidatus Eisenbacteria bacterium]
GDEIDERRGLGTGPTSGPGPRQDAAPPGRPLSTAGARPLWMPSGSPAVAGAPRNIRINDRVSDRVFGAVQSEVSLAASGSRVVAAWNDGETEAVPGPVGFGYSSDGGATWVDGGALPLGDSVSLYESDPVVAVNEKEFYLAVLATSARSGRKAVAVLTGGFTGTAFQWQPPVLARTAVSLPFPDKPWLVADSLSGNLYLSYTMFVISPTFRSDWIDFQRSTDDNASWTEPLKVSSTRDEGLVQGSRPVVGPAGEVHLVWSAVDTSATSGGLDHFRARTSRDGGVTFGREADVADVFSNFGSGAPGFNLGRGNAFPSVAVDRSPGIRRGRVYVCWQEPLDVFHDVPDSTGSQEERELNDQPMDASPLQIGSVIRGTITSSSDFDFFAFSGLQGQTVELYLDSLAVGLAPELRLLCTDGSTQLAFNRPAPDARPRFLIFTLPASGSYYAKVESSGPGSGGYRLRSGFARRRGERGRDHRDLFVAHSDDGIVWSDPVRLNDDPGWFDDWLPEVAVSAEGRAYAAWYDWRDSPASSCGGWSGVYLARSDDGGDSWSSLGPVADRLTNWSEVAGLKIPNQGDYISLFANDRTVFIAWADGRSPANGNPPDPDIYLALRDLSAEPPPAPPRPLALERVFPNPTRGDAVADVVLGDGGPARLELYDLAGRKLRSMALATSIPGRHAVALPPGPRLAPGVYALRVVQGERSATARFSVVH